jgi:ABC-type transporter Mla subunit MlaD
MNKKIVAVAMAVVFGLCTAGMGFAAKLNCTVDGVDGDKVTMTCEDADKLAPGDKVKVTPGKKKGAIEGC